MISQIKKRHNKLVLVLSFFLLFALGGFLSTKAVFATPAQAKQDVQETPSRLTVMPDSEKTLLAEENSNGESPSSEEGGNLPEEENSQTSEKTSPANSSSGSSPTNEEVPEEYKLDSPISVGDGSIGGIIGAIIDILFGAAAVVALIYIIIGGYNYITSSGNPEALEAAKGTIVNAIIGLLIVLASYLAIDLLLDSLKVNIDLSI